LKIYESQLQQLNEEVKKLASLDLKMSIGRLLIAIIAIASLYQGYQTDQSWYWILGAAIIVIFFFLVKKQRALRWELSIAKAKITINSEEIGFLAENKMPFANGEEFVEHKHSYSYDLDFFGEKSLFQTLNRTNTVVGKRALAEALLTIKPQQEILSTQEAIKELTPQLSWRQHFSALGKLKADDADSYNRLVTWAEQQPPKIPKIVKILAYLLPLLLFTSIAVYLVTANSLFSSFAWLFALANLAMLGNNAIAIKNELAATTKIEHILKQYAHLLDSIETSEFVAEILSADRNKLSVGSIQSSMAVRELSVLFGRLEHVANIFASPILNGLFQYHTHVLLGLVDWRKKYGNQIKVWLEVIGEYEKYSSMANFAYNNPDFMYPEINHQLAINFEDLGHPLIAQSKRVTNTISFENEQFIILTGSNMSGKSTFLRTVGLNMILAGVGAPVCASSARVHPLPVLVSMRLSDSLSDSESYFYAEVKRLKYIMDHLAEEACFVLLDEILRGTNSDDKRDGTMEVIRKMATNAVYGGIATHDLEVCKVTEEFPKMLANKRFEVAIVNDELLFDYKLQDGICQNKSASFIMKKMGVI
jgi:hypothetical protein